MPTPPISIRFVRVLLTATCLSGLCFLLYKQYIDPYGLKPALFSINFLAKYIPGIVLFFMIYAFSFFIACLLLALHWKKTWSRLVSAVVLILIGSVFLYEMIMNLVHHNSISLSALILVFLFGLGAISLFSKKADTWLEVDIHRTESDLSSYNRNIFRLTFAFVFGTILFLLPAINGYIAYQKRRPDIEMADCIKDAFEASCRYFEIEPNGTVTLSELKKNGLRIPSNVTLKILDGNQTTLYLQTEYRNREKKYFIDAQGAITNKRKWI